MITPDLEKKAYEHFRKVDPVLGSILDKIPKYEWNFGASYFHALVDSVVGQQLSIKAADTIFARVVALCGEEGLTAEAIHSLDPQILRNAGLSWQKVSYVKDIAEKDLSSSILFEQFDLMSDEEVITELVKIKGVGKWTAEMFLLFRMGRPDVFSYGDLGIRKAIQRLYGLKKEPSEKKALQIASKWRPYRSIACRVLWKSLEL